jgi:NAD(P)H dehydrogenase (quinone)
MTMRVLTIYAHPNPTSFCHAALEQFTKGLEDAGHVSEVVDLYASGFNPVFGMHDFTQFAHESVPREVLESMQLRETVLSLSGDPLRRFLARRWLRDKDVYDVVRMIAQHRPADVIEQQEKVARADGMAFIAPIFWMGFPAMLKGWIERVLAYGFAYSLTPEGWQGEMSGRVPLLQQQKALIINTTFFSESDYEQGFGDAIRTLVDDFTFRYPGFASVEHVYFYAVGGVDDQTRQGYLQRAYRLGREFEGATSEDETEVKPALATAGNARTA